MFEKSMPKPNASLFSYRRKQRASLIPAIQAVSLVLVFAAPLLWGSLVYTSSPARYDRVVVHKGDTLWALVAKRATPGADVAEAAYSAAAINHLNAGERLLPGRVLLIPKPH